MASPAKPGARRRRNFCPRSSSTVSLTSGRSRSLTAAALVALWAKPQPCRVRAEGARAEPRDKSLRVARVRGHARGRRAEALLPRARERVKVRLPPQIGFSPCPARNPPARLSRAARVARVARVARRYVPGAIGLGAIEWQLQVDED